MKKPIITIVIVIMVFIIGWVGYKRLWKDTDTLQEETPTPTGSVFPSPTGSLPLPTVTASPEVSDTELYPAYQETNGQKSYGYIDGGGNFVIQPVYGSASDFTDGVAVVQDLSLSKVIDRNGNVLFENEDVISAYSNGAAVFTKTVGTTRLSGYIDTEGKVIIEPNYILADNFNQDNKAYVSTETGKYALIDKSGNILESYELASNYDTVIAFQDGYVLYTDPVSKKTGVVTVGGEQLYEPIYSDINYLGSDRFAVVTSPVEFYELLWAPCAIFNKEGVRLTEDTLYDLSNYNGEFASATDSKYTYFVELDGKEVTTLPKVEGRGTLTMLGDIIKANIDQEIIYMRKDGSVLWQNDKTAYLDNGISVKAVKFKSNKYVLVNYPQVEGLADLEVQNLINEQLKGFFTDARVNLKEKDMLSVEDTFSAQLLNGLLILQKKGYDYPFGAAHGMPIREYYHIDIKTGDFYQLSDLFKEGSDYVTKLNMLLKSQIDEQSKASDTFLFPDSFQGISENQGFIIAKDALIIYFTPYEIAAYAAGFPKFKIPYDDIKDLINDSGVFWKSFH